MSKLFWAILAIVAAVTIVPYLTMISWNCVMPYLFKLNTISFWQAAALMLLAGVFLKKWSK